jgi:hypothetical protein
MSEPVFAVCERMAEVQAVPRRPPCRPQAQGAANLVGIRITAGRFLATSRRIHRRTTNPAMKPRQAQPIGRLSAGFDPSVVIIHPAVTSLCIAQKHRIGFNCNE